MKYSKPALTFEEQSDLLLSRGVIGDRDEMISCLSTVNYYRLSAYWAAFRCEGTEQLKSGTRFDHIWERYVFDQRLRILVLEAIERIEVAIRTHLAYLHAHLHGPFAYATNPRSLPGLTGGPEADPRSHAAFVAEVRSCVHRAKGAPFIRHYRSKYSYEQHLPIWMVTEIMSLGGIARMYQGCDLSLRQPMAAELGVKISELDSWLVMLNDVRNICAHHGRLWNRKLVKVPKLPDHPAWRSPVRVDPTTVFAALTICSYLLLRISPEGSWQRRVRELIEAFPAIPKGSAKHGGSMGLPDNWLDCPIWAAARVS